VPIGGVVDRIPLEAAPAGVGFGFGSAWVGLTTDMGGLLIRVDPTSDHVVARIPVGGFPTRMVAGAGAMWVSNDQDGTLSRVDPATNRVTATIPVGPNPFGIGVDSGMVWVGESGDSSAVRVDPARNRWVQTVRLGGGNQFRGLSAGFGSVWVVSDDGRVSRLDAATGRTIATIRIPRCCDGEFAMTADAVWFSNTIDNRVRRIDPATNQVTRTVAVGNSPFGIGLAGGLVWVTHGREQLVEWISPGAGRVLGQTPLTSFSGTLAVGAGSVWVPTFDDHVLYRLQAGKG
jgi:YVTN family beta-propeller protein